jgi:hypothetical protein
MGLDLRLTPQLLKNVLRDLVGGQEPSRVVSSTKEEKYILISIIKSK